MSSVTTESQHIHLIRCSDWQVPIGNHKSKSSLISFWPISSKYGWNVDLLSKQLQSRGYSSVVRREFVRLTENIRALRKEKKIQKKAPILLQNELRDIISRYFYSPEELKGTQKLLHELGFILDFEFQHVILEPQWLSTVFCSVVSLKNSHQIKNGLISRSQLHRNLATLLDTQTQQSPPQEVEASEQKETKANKSSSSLEMLLWICQC